MASNLPDVMVWQQGDAEASSVTDTCHPEPETLYVSLSPIESCADKVTTFVSTHQTPATNATTAPTMKSATSDVPAAIIATTLVTTHPLSALVATARVTPNLPTAIATTAPVTYTNASVTMNAWPAAMANDTALAAAGTVATPMTSSK
ncbi:hypothetical protein MMC18_009136 [Xylographa bjoerkii]|nr:hypothetical protein [Xylographa bjoerkii]